MTQRANTQQVTDYKIDRHKFFDTQERRMLLEITAEMAREDAHAGRITWVTRWMLIHLALYSGLRVSEIAALTPNELHLTGEYPYIRVTRGKRGKSRDVYIDRELTAHLQEYSTGMARTQRLFPVTTTALHISFKRACATANLRTDLTIHSARHTYATTLLAATANLKYVQKQLGHSTMNMTALYADILPEQNGKLANMILQNP